MVVVVDDEDRENEGDLTLAAEFVTPEAINFMAKYGRGLDLPDADGGTSGLSAAGADDAGEYVAVWDGVYGEHRGAGGCDDGDLGGGPGAYDQGGDRSASRRRTIWLGRGMCFRCGRARAGCW